jgi:hypothetical protein
LTFNNILGHRHYIGGPWSVEHFKYDWRVKEIATNICKAIGVSEDATPAELKAFDGRLTCGCGHPAMKGLTFHELVGAFTSLP